MMSPEAKQKIQLVLLLAFVVAGLRAGYILYQRHEDKLAVEKQKKAETAAFANADDYVTPKKLYPYDLKSAKQLTQQPVWVKEGYRYTYYGYDAPGKRVDFAHEAGLLLPIEQLAIKDVVTAAGPGGRNKWWRYFRKMERVMRCRLGSSRRSNTKYIRMKCFTLRIRINLYKHWPADVWQAVERHEVKPGMNEMQADFAVGMGVPDAGTSSGKTVRYPNGGKPLVVLYQDGKAVEIKPETAGS